MMLLSKLKGLTLNDTIDIVEDFNDLVLDTNAERVRADWENLGYPTTLCENNPYRLAYKASEGVRLSLFVINFFKTGLGG